MTTRASRPLAAVVLAAGKGKRFPGVPSKVLVRLAGKPLVGRVLDAIRAVSPRRIVVIVGHGKEHVTRAVSAADIEVVDQGEPRGTGHAVLAARPALEDRQFDLVVLSGDVPLLQPATIARLLQSLRGRDADCALLSAVVADPQSYGRIIRRHDGGVQAIVETADATPEELLVREINVGAYAFRAPEIFQILSTIGADNAQGEFYLTDAVRKLVQGGRRVEAVVLDDEREGQGINTPAELAALEAVLLSK